MYNLKTQNTAIISETMTRQFADFIDASPRTVETYRKAVTQMLRYFHAEGISQPSKQDIINWRNSLKESHSANTVQSYLIACRAFFSWTEESGMYPNVAKSVKGVKVSKEHRKEALTAEQARDLMNIDTNSETGRRDKAMISLMVTTGLRDCEVARANVSDLQNVAGTTVLYVQGKGKEEKADFVKVPAEVEQLIRSYLADREPAEALFTGTSNRAKGKAMTTRSISRIIKARLQVIGIDSERVTAHSLRHTAVTLALMNGNSLQEAQQFARHANITTTQIYAHNLDKLANNCSTAVAGALF